MRPRYLELEGLQSFKDVQGIDFDRLGEMGLFGIFGPTGSGKSTILDAITLALYGNVQRAQNRTQGIMNTEVDIMRVLFVFDLIKDNERRNYRVERVYRRKKDSELSIEAKITRLFESTPAGDIILADKQGEVNDAVVELIGLEFDDFTRSVVLPQNKFQEFLLSPKAEKTKMLERIFCLEEYGKQLTERVNKKLSFVRYKLSSIEGAMAVLGDASKERLKEAEDLLKAEALNKEKFDGELKSLEDRYNKLRTAWELTMELSEIESALSEQLLHAALYDEKKKLFERSLRAESIAVNIKSYHDASKNLEDSQRLLVGINGRVPALESELARTRALQEAAVKRAKQEVPGLSERKNKLKEAAAELVEIEQLEKQLVNLRNSFTSTRGEIDRVDKGIEKNKKVMEGLGSQIDESRRKSDSLRISPEYRKKIQAGLRLEDDCRRAGKDFEEKRSKLKELGEKLEMLQKAMIDIEKQLSEKKIQLEKAEDALDKHSAMQLAKTLSAGMPCPVCGSTEHPKPAYHDSDSGFEVLEKNIASLEDEYAVHKTAMERKTVEIEHIKAEYERTGKAFKEAEEELAAKEKALADILKSLDITDFSAENQRLENADKDLEELQGQMTVLQKNMDQARLEADTLNDSKQKLMDSFADIRAKGEGLKAEKESKEKIIQKINLAGSPESELAAIDISIKNLEEEETRATERLRETEAKYNTALADRSTLAKQCEIYTTACEGEKTKLEMLLKEKGFTGIGEAEQSVLAKEEQAKLESDIKAYEDTGSKLAARKAVTLKKLGDKKVTDEEWTQTSSLYSEMKQEKENCISRFESAKNTFETLKKNYETWIQYDKDREFFSRKKDMLEQIKKLLQGNSFIEYISEERLRYIAKEASETLGILTKFRYSLELDTDNGFVVRDNANGGVHRLVSTLSGGETFLTSLSLALALSSHIQLKGQSPLEFFFLDEGFGTLDNNLLDVVMDSLERLSTTKRVIGLISHVPEMKNRMSRRLIVEQPVQGGRGSQVRIEKA